MDEFALQCALEELEAVAQKGGFLTEDVVALLKVMEINEVVEYLDAKMSNRLQ